MFQSNFISVITGIRKNTIGCELLFIWTGKRNKHSSGVSSTIALNRSFQQMAHQCECNQRYLEIEKRQSFVKGSAVFANIFKASAFQ